MKKKGIEMDYGKPDRQLFLDGIRQECKWDRYVKWLLIIMVLYFGVHIYYAMSSLPNWQ